MHTSPIIFVKLQSLYQIRLKHVLFVCFHTHAILALVVDESDDIEQASASGTAAAPRVDFASDLTVVTILNDSQRVRVSARHTLGVEKVSLWPLCPVCGFFCWCFVCQAKTHLRVGANERL